MKRNKTIGFIEAAYVAEVFYSNGIKFDFSTLRMEENTILIDKDDDGIPVAVSIDLLFAKFTRGK